MYYVIQRVMNSHIISGKCELNVDDCELNVDDCELNVDDLV